MKVIPETCLAHYIFIIAVYFVPLLSYMLTVGRVWLLLILKYIETSNESTLFMGSIPNREKQGYKIDNTALSLFKHAVLINKITKF
jgi:hypothetical protein